MWTRCGRVARRTNPGRENVVGIIAQFGDTDVDTGRDYKVRLLLHSVVTYAARPDQKEKLEPVVAAIASQLASDRAKPMKGALIRELRFAGTPSAAKAISPFLTDEELCSDAANALRSIREGATALLLRRSWWRRATVGQRFCMRWRAGEPAVFSCAAGRDCGCGFADTFLEACWGRREAGRCRGTAHALLKAGDAAKDWERIQITADARSWPHLRLRQRKQIAIVQQILGRVLESFPTNIRFFHAVSSNRGTHRSIDNRDALFEYLFEWMLVKFGHSNCGITLVHAGLSGSTEHVRNQADPGYIVV